MPLGGLALLPYIICRRVNQNMFSGCTKVESYASGEQVRNVQMPSVAPKEGSDEEKLLKARDLNQIQNAYAVPHLDKQLPNLITLSLLPRSQWQNLTNLDIIKVSLS
ncbi:hypothetical protein BHE74_00048637 [Ensete ventricosum]|nr:hypothetical protein BHE74_00048637 [Ensete ventricosum]